MIAQIAKRGTSFKGAGLYYLHDKKADTSERVAWTQTRNLQTDNPDMALRVMAATAMDKDRLKAQAGVSTQGENQKARFIRIRLLGILTSKANSTKRRC